MIRLRAPVVLGLVLLCATFLGTELQKQWKAQEEAATANRLLAAAEQRAAEGRAELDAAQKALAAAQKTLHDHVAIAQAETKKALEEAHGERAAAEHAAAEAARAEKEKEAARQHRGLGGGAIT